MFLGKGSDADEVNTVRRGSVVHSPTGSARRTSMPLLTPIVTSSASVHETDHEVKHVTNLQVPSANLPALRDESTLSLIFQVMAPSKEAAILQLTRIPESDLLSPGNFLVWKRRATDILLSSGLLDLVTTNDEVFIPFSELNDSDLKTACAQLGLKTATIFQFKFLLAERLSFGYTLLKRLCGRAVLNSLQRIKAGDARALWKFILHTFDRVTPITIRQRKAAFSSLQMDSKEDVSAYINRCLHVSSQLVVAPSEEDLFDHIVTGLPARFDFVVSAIDIGFSSGRCSLLELETKLVDAEERIASRRRDSLNPVDVNHTTTSSSSELCRNFAKGKCNYGDRCRYLHVHAGQQKNKNNRACFTCGSRYHFKNDPSCLGKPSENKNEANVVTSSVVGQSDDWVFHCRVDDADVDTDEPLYSLPSDLKRMSDQSSSLCSMDFEPIDVDATNVTVMLNHTTTPSATLVASATVHDDVTISGPFATRPVTAISNHPTNACATLARNS